MGDLDDEITLKIHNKYSKSYDDRENANPRHANDDGPRREDKLLRRTEVVGSRGRINRRNRP